MKKCKQGYYYCYKDKKCKRIPGGYRVGLGGYLRRERKKRDLKIVVKPKPRKMVTEMVMVETVVMVMVVMVAVV